MIDWLIRRAQRTPYFDLPGYMRRWWLVPYNHTIWRTVTYPEPPEGPPYVSSAVVRDGTGPVCWWRRPIARGLQLCGIAVRVHEILRSDNDRNPHDHPWPYLTVVLRGGYYEHRYDAAGKQISVRWHGPGSIMYRPAQSWHRLDLPTGATTTTLFITGRKAQSWGFNVDGRKVPYWEYLR